MADRYYPESSVNEMLYDYEHDGIVGCPQDYPYIELPQSNWHTGTPTEEGWYLVQHLTDAEYCGSKFFVARWDGEKFVINPRPPIVVTYPNGTAWQKIEPYKEK